VVERQLSSANGDVAELKITYCEPADDYFADLDEFESEYEDSARNDVEGRDVFADVADPV
jgi:hypothetical protein